MFKELASTPREAGLVVQHTQCSTVLLGVLSSLTVGHARKMFLRATPGPNIGTGNQKVVQLEFGKS